RGVQHSMNWIVIFTAAMKLLHPESVRGGYRLCSPPLLLWLHRGSTKLARAPLVGQPTKALRTGSAVNRPGPRPPCTGTPSSMLRLPGGRDFPGDRREQAASAREPP